MPSLMINASVTTVTPIIPNMLEHSLLVLPFSVQKNSGRSPKDIALDPDGPFPEADALLQEDSLMLGDQGNKEPRHVEGNIGMAHRNQIISHHNNHKGGYTLRVGKKTVNSTRELNASCTWLLTILACTKGFFVNNFIEEKKKCEGVAPKMEERIKSKSLYFFKGEESEMYLCTDKRGKLQPRHLDGDSTSEDVAGCVFEERYVHNLAIERYITSWKGPRLKKICSNIKKLTDEKVQKKCNKIWYLQINAEGRVKMAKLAEEQPADNTVKMYFRNEGEDNKKSHVFDNPFTPQPTDKPSRVTNRHSGFILGHDPPKLDKQSSQKEERKDKNPFGSDLLSARPRNFRHRKRKLGHRQKKGKGQSKKYAAFNLGLQ